MLENWGTHCWQTPFLDAPCQLLEGAAARGVPVDNGWVVGYKAKEEAGQEGRCGGAEQTGTAATASDAPGQIRTAGAGSPPMNSGRVVSLVAACVAIYNAWL